MEEGRSADAEGLPARSAADASASLALGVPEAKRQLEAHRSIIETSIGKKVMVQGVKEALDSWTELTLRAWSLSQTLGDDKLNLQRKCEKIAKMRDDAYRQLNKAFEEKKEAEEHRAKAMKSIKILQQACPTLPRGRSERGLVLLASLRVIKCQRVFTVCTIRQELSTLADLRKQAASQPSSSKASTPSIEPVRCAWADGQKLSLCNAQDDEADLGGEQEAESHRSKRTRGTSTPPPLPTLPPHEARSMKYSIQPQATTT